MRDPHVVSLHYRFKTPEGIVYKDPAPLQAETDAFRAHLSDGALRIELNAHYAALEEARSVVEPFLRSWEILSGLEYGWSEVTFEFQHGEIVDRIPPPPGVIEGHIMAMAGGGQVRATGTAISCRHQYPAAPHGFAVNPDVETLWARFQGYRKGREPLLSMAYFCFTFLEALAGHAKSASASFAVSQPVLRKLSELSSTRGDVSEARKLEPGRPATPLAPQEKVWLEKTVLEIIRRVGEHGAGKSSRKLTMADLPRL